jgi:hypothetical protein
LSKESSSLPAGSARTAESVDVHSLTIKTKELPPQQIDSLY